MFLPARICGLVLQARKLFYHSTSGSRVKTKGKLNLVFPSLRNTYVGTLFPKSPLKPPPCHSDAYSTMLPAPSRSRVTPTDSKMKDLGVGERGGERGGAGGGRGGRAVQAQPRLGVTQL